MKVAVSDTNPNSLLPQALHIVSAQIKANSFVLTSSARVCMRMSRLMVLRILSSATVSAHDARQSRRRVLACSLLLEDNWTWAHIGIWDISVEESCRIFSSRQKPTADWLVDYEYDDGYKKKQSLLPSSQARLLPRISSTGHRSSLLAVISTEAVWLLSMSTRGDNNMFM